MAIRARHLLILLLAIFVKGERYRPVTENALDKALKELENTIKSESNNTLNLPANASSIRENITDTFSCENRTYGYYADVDNDCQVFHVCLPSQTPSGRNVTYRWSFICPNETIFNQEVLTCTRPADSIDCKDSPLFYHLNMEIGKVSNKTEEGSKKTDGKRIQMRKPENRKENIVMMNLTPDIVTDEFLDKLEVVESGGKSNEVSPMLIEAVIETFESDVEDVEEEQRKEEEMDRMVMERNMRNERKMRRGAFRFKGDV